MVALTGELDEACRGAEIRGRLESFNVVGQSGEDFADRLLPYLGDLIRTERDREVLLSAAPLVQERLQLLGEAPALASLS